VGAGSQNSDCSWVCRSCWTDGWLTITLTMLSRFSSSSTTEIIDYSPAGELQRVASTTPRTRRLSVSSPPHFGMQPYDTNLLPCTGLRREVSPNCSETPRLSSTSDPRRRRVLRRSNLQFLTIGERLRIRRSYPVSQTQGPPTVSSPAPSSWDVASPAFWYEFLCKVARSRRFRWRFPADPWPRTPDLGALSVGTDIIGWPTRQMGA